MYYLYEYVLCTDILELHKVAWASAPLWSTLTCLCVDAMGL